MGRAYGIMAIFSLTTLLLVALQAIHAATALPTADPADHEAGPPSHRTIHRREETQVFADYTLTYFDEPLNPPLNTSNLSPLMLAATAGSQMTMVLCTDTPIYYGNCITISLDKDGCVDFPEGNAFDKTISSIEIKTMTALCRMWRSHLCAGDDAAYLNMGDTSRDLVHMSDWSDQISSIACYWDPRGVTGVWE
jgi:hypothetical protein